MIPIDNLDGGLRADYSKPFDKSTNRTFSIAGSIGGTDLTEHLSPQQIYSNLGLNYPGSQYHAGDTKPVRAPIVARIDMPVTDEIRARAKVPLDPVLVEKIVDMGEGAASPELSERAGAFREAYAGRITMIPRKDTLGPDGQTYRISDDSRRAMERLQGEQYNIAVGREDGQEAPYTGHSAPGTFDVSEYTVIGTELYIPSRDAIPLARNTKISVIMAREDESDPARMDRPAGERHLVAYIGDDGAVRETADSAVRDWLQSKACDEHLKRHPDDGPVMTKRWRPRATEANQEKTSSRAVQEHIERHPEPTKAGMGAIARGRDRDAAIEGASAAEKEELTERKRKRKKEAKKKPRDSESD